MWNIFKNGRLNDLGKFDGIANYPSKTKEISFEFSMQDKKGYIRKTPRLFNGACFLECDGGTAYATCCFFSATR
ncbi:hypothetical protein OFC87_40055, partial [Escherichia coli]|nr:hypothetical protein [Escherichia coli]